MVLPAGVATRYSCGEEIGSQQRNFFECDRHETTQIDFDNVLLHSFLLSCFIEQRDFSSREQPRWCIKKFLNQNLPDREFADVGYGSFETGG